ncbi:MAG: ImmA/IrrE family metallo-endopeptidase [Oscillospiraceae bacterium]|nr:ImmA/IrrE family metallo-endopeptidase [Oscillospiraceae bacterium]
MRKIDSGKLMAGEFVRKYRLTEVTSACLEKILEQMGYTIANFGSNEASDTIISELKLRSYADNTRGFTYADSNYRIVFIDEGLSEEERRIVLAHETGHILCGHFGAVPVIGNDVMEEYEANEFVHWLLNPNIFVRAKAGIVRHKIITAVCAVSLAIAAVIGVFAVKMTEERIYYGEYYVTASGSKYHVSDCRIIKDKSNTRRLTKEDMELGKYDPCEVCIPQD